MQRHCLFFSGFGELQCALQARRTNYSLSTCGRGLIRANLFVDLAVVGQFAVDGGAVQRGDGHRLHGDELDFVRKSPACVCGPRHPIDMFKDGG